MAERIKRRIKKHWICEECQQEVWAEQMPNFNWADGHICKFKRLKNDK